MTTGNASAAQAVTIEHSISANNINTMNMTFGDGVTLTATGNITNLPATPPALTIGAGSTLSYIGADRLNLSNLNVPNPINVDTNRAVTIELTPEQNQANFVATGPGTVITFAVAPETYTVTPELIAGTNGRFLIRDVTNNSIVNTRDITNGVASGSDFQVTSDSTTSYIAYYKLDGTFTADGAIDYQIAFRSFSGTTLSANVAVAPIQVPSVFTAPLTSPTPQVASFAFSSGNSIDLTWSADVANNAEATAANILAAKNANAWIDWHALNNFTVEYYSLGASSSGSWNAAASPNINGGNTATFPTDQGVIFRSDTGAQRQVTQQSGFNTVSAGTSPNTYNEVINANVGNAPIPVVISALDSSSTGARVQRIENGVGYAIGTGGDTRLIGIKPRSANYDPNTPYGGNL